MPKTSVGIQITSSRATVVHLKGGLKSAEVGMVETIRQESPDSSFISDIKSGNLPPYDSVVASLGGEKVFLRVVDVPFTDKRRALGLAPLEAEDSLPLPLEQLYLSSQVIGKGDSSTRTLVAAAPRKSVGDLNDSLSENGFAASVMDTDPTALVTLNSSVFPAGGNHLLIEVDDELSQCVAFINGNFHGFTILPGLSEPGLFVAELARYVSLVGERGYLPAMIYLCGPGAESAISQGLFLEFEIGVELIPFPSRVVSASGKYMDSWPSWSVPLGLALRDMGTKKASQINLLQGDLAPRGSKIPFKGNMVAAAIYAVILLILWGAAVGLETSRKEQELASLERSVRAVFTRSLPEVKNIVDEVNQMTNRVNELSEKAESLGTLLDKELSPLSLLMELSSRIPKEIVMELRDFQAEESRLRIEGTTSSFDAIDRIKANLQAFDRFESVTVSDAKAGVSSDKVIFKMTITYGRDG